MRAFLLEALLEALLVLSILTAKRFAQRAHAAAVVEWFNFDFKQQTTCTSS